MFLNGSAVLFNGTNSFFKNSASFVIKYTELRNKCFSSDNSVVWTRSSGGAITSYSSTIIILDYSTETCTSATSEFSFNRFSRCYLMNDSNNELVDSQVMQFCSIKSNVHQNSDYYCIREYNLPCLCSNISTKNCIPSTKFYHNFAKRYGGSVYSLNSSIKAVGAIEFVRNSARKGGALHLIKTNFCFIGSPCLTCCVHLDNSLQLSSHMLFLNNSAGMYGGVLYLVSSNYTYYGNISFVNNSANYGGALFARLSNISLNVKKHSSQIFTGAYTVFMNNLAQNTGGAIYVTNTTNTQIYGSVSLIRNCAFYSGGAIKIWIQLCRCMEVYL